jgi:hypothetical protein
MRTTINIDDDVLSRAKALAVGLHESFRTVINEALRAGLDCVEEPAPKKPYSTRPHKMGLCDGRNLDNIQELLAQTEGEEFR